MDIGSVFLTGFMGVGKSQIGSLLALRMRRDFLDTDELIESRDGRAISSIFEEEGEAYFRELEHTCVVDACACGDVVRTRVRTIPPMGCNWDPLAFPSP